MAELRYCLSEGLRNAVNARFGGGLILLMMALAVVSSGLADTASTQDFIDRERQWVRAGGTVLVVSSDNGIDAGSCERLSRSAGITGSALLVASGAQVRTGRAPGVPLALSEATFGLLGLVGVEGPWGAAMSREVADDLGLEDLGWLTVKWSQTPSGSSAGRLSDAPVRVRVIDAPLLPQNYATGLILLTGSAGISGECIVATTPAAKEEIRGALPGMLASAGTVSIADRLVAGKFGEDLSRGYAARITKWLPLAAGAAVGLAWLLMAWQRRSREGLYATLGFTRAHRALISTAEWLILSGAGALLGLLLAAVIAPLTGQHYPAVHWTLLRSSAAAWLTASGISALTALISPRAILSALKDR